MAFCLIGEACKKVRVINKCDNALLKPFCCTLFCDITFCMTRHCRRSQALVPCMTVESRFASMRLWKLCCALVQQYRVTLCTTDLHCHCAPPTCVVHHGAQDCQNRDQCEWCIMEYGLPGSPETRPESKGYSAGLRVMYTTHTAGTAVLPPCSNPLTGNPSSHAG